MPVAIQKPNPNGLVQSQISVMSLDYILIGFKKEGANKNQVKYFYSNYKIKQYNKEKTLEFIPQRLCGGQIRIA